MQAHVPSFNGTLDLFHRAAMEGLLWVCVRLSIQTVTSGLGRFNECSVYGMLCIWPTALLVRRTALLVRRHAVSNMTMNDECHKNNVDLLPYIEPAFLVW
jgi:hypothetical protein